MSAQKHRDNSDQAALWRIHLAVGICVTLKSLMNPILTIFMNRGYRKTLCMVVKRCCPDALFQSGLYAFRDSASRQSEGQTNAVSDNSIELHGIEQREEVGGVTSTDVRLTSTSCHQEPHQHSRDHANRRQSGKQVSSNYFRIKLNFFLNILLYHLK